MLKRKIFVAGAVMAATMLSTNLPTTAQSNADIESLINSWLQSRSVNDLAPNQQVIRSNFHTRLNQLQNRLQVERRNGTLNATEAANLRTRLNRIEDRLRRSNMDEGGFTVGEARALMLDMRQMTLALNRQSSDTDTGRRQTVAADLNDLRNRVEKARRNGDITRAQENHLNSSLRWITSELNRLDNNGLSSVEDRRIRNHISTVEARLKNYREVASNRNDLASEIRRVETKLDRARRTGRLSNAEVARLTRDLNYVRSVQNRVIRSGRGLSNEEERYVRGLLSAVERGLNIYM